MNYQLEALGDERFQQLCQAILAATHHDIQCLPVGQPDGGRDAFQKRQAGKFAVFQVKFVREPFSRESRDLVEQVVKSEKAKVQRLIARGASEYSLLTNVRGTSHLDAGSIDRLNAYLSEELGVPSRCYWRDDIERSIDAIPGLKWSYPEILRAMDLLEGLINFGPREDVESKRRSDTIRSYLAHQARQDSQLKFKQIELQKTIVDLFVDVPCRLVLPPETDEQLHMARWGEFFHRIAVHRHSDSDSALRSEGALELMVQHGFAEEAPRLVIEGAPGQGKSTVTQYLCQVHRMELLASPDLSRVTGSHRPKTPRIPFRVDLRDYASWLSGRNPFSENASEPLAQGTPPVLESFIAAQILHQTGATFTVEDLIAVSKKSQILIVLDGFDEVAEIRLRNRIVEEVSAAAARVSENAISSQIIVTSRPAAFANSPGFPRDEWQHLEILSLTRPIIEQYAQQWLTARGEESREATRTLSLLNEKLEQPHVRDLARNPMQLAILLSLVSVQGASLPNKRTSLYDNYVEIFLNRESEKSDVVRDHRELLVQIHRYLAWYLHTEAEQSGAGNITESKLKRLLRNYLDEQEHPTDLVDKLFTGMVERVVALVSRIQGTYEFEVQPLREYFAARHLYDTAPYAPVGKTVVGTLPDRFDALCRNFYWLNVTRFYAGCYNSGELASISDRWGELAEAEGFEHVGYTARLAITLLNDYAFSQNPRLASRLAKDVLRVPSYKSFLGEEQNSQGAEALLLSTGPGRNVLLADAKEQITGPERIDVTLAYCKLLAVNCDFEEIWRFWNDVKDRIPSGDKNRLAQALRIFRDIPVELANELVTDVENAGASFVRVNRWDVLEAHPSLWNDYLDYLLASGFTDIPLRPDRSAVSSPGGVLAKKLSALLWPYMLADMGSFKHVSLREKINSVFAGPHEKVPYEIADGSLVGTEFEEVGRVADSILDQTSHALLSNPALWSELLSSISSLRGYKWALYSAALNFASNAITPPDEEVDLFNDQVDHLRRVLSARANAANSRWCNRQIAALSELPLDGRKFVIVCLLRWMPTEALIKKAKSISNEIDKLETSDWMDIARTLQYSDFPGGSARRILLRAGDLPKSMSPRLATTILRAVRRTNVWSIWTKYLASYDGPDPDVLDARWEVAATRAQKDERYWRHALSAASHAYGHGHIPSLHWFRVRGSDITLPDAISREILDNASDYPLMLVGIASVSQAVGLGARARALGRVAHDDKWVFS